MGQIQPSKLVRYLIAIAAPVVALIITLLLQSIITGVPFIFFFVALTFSAAIGGLDAGMITALLSVLFVDYFLFAPVHEFSGSPRDLVLLSLFTIVAFIISLVHEGRRRAEITAQQEREWLQTTLTSIGDAVIATDALQQIKFMNKVAETLTGWQSETARGKAVKDVFRIVNEFTRQPVENPLSRVLQEGIVVGLANHTLLIGKDGKEYFIDDSGAPIRSADGSISGAVLVFRDITVQKRGQNTARFLDEITRELSSSLDFEITLQRVCRLVVPTLADWCSINLVADDGFTLKAAAIAHRDPALEEAARQIGAVYPVNLASPFPSVEALRSGRPQLIPEIPQQVMELVTDPAVITWIQRLNLKSALHIPLIVRERKLGVITLNIAGSNTKRFSSDDLPLAEELGHRIGTAIDNARLYHEAQESRQVTERLADRANRLQAVTSHLSTLLQPADVAKAVVEECLGVLDSAQRGLVALLADGSEWLEIVYVRGYGEHIEQWSRMSMSNTALPIVYSVKHREALFLSSKEQWRLLSPEMPDLMTNPSLALVPLLVDERVIGALVISFDQVQAFGAEDRSFILGLAQQCAQAFERTRLFHAEQQARASAEARQQQLSFLAQASEVLATSLDYQITLSHIAELAVPVIADWCAIDLLDEAGNLQEVTVISDNPEKVAAVKKLRATYTPDDPRPSPPRVVAQTGKSFLIPTISWEDIVKSGSAPDTETEDLLRSINMKSLLYVPLKSSRKMLGVISLTTNDSGRHFGPEEVTIAEELARRAGIAIENSLLYREMHQQRERLQTTLTSIGDALIATDNKGNITFMNPIAQSLTGWSESEAVGKDIQDIFSIVNEASHETVESPVTKVLREGIIVGLANHTVLIAKNGKGIPIDDSGAPIKDEKGNMVGVILVFRDISERVRFEVEKEQLLQQLRQAVQRTSILQQVTSSLSGAVTASDITALFIDKARDIIGAAAGSLVKLIDAETLEVIDTLNYDAAITEQWKRFSIDAPFPLSEAVKIATPVWIESREVWLMRYKSHPVSSQYNAWVGLPLIVKGKTIGGVGYSFDDAQQFSEEDRSFMVALAAQYAQAFDRALLYEAQQQAVRLRDEFLSVAAHELKTPVTSMRGFAQMILRQLDKRGTVEPTQLQQGLTVIDAQSVKLSKLISQLLDISRIEAGRLVLERQETNIVVLVQNVVTQIQTNTTHHSIVLDAPETLVYWGDPIRLEQVIVNLVDNAIKYSPEGGLIEVKTWLTEPRTIQIVVQDHGIGVPVERRQFLFNRFYQAHGEGHLGGMGLGLYISRQIIELHGGQLYAEFPVEGGTHFVISLPIVSS